MSRLLDDRGISVLARTARRLTVAMLLVAALAAGGVGLAPQAGSAAAASRWAPAASAPIHPGVQVVTPIGQCTANFVFFQGSEVFLGMAAHCTSLGASNQLDGCSVRSLPLGTPVQIAGATRPGTLAYSSWLAMQVADEQSASACRGNDFALVRVDPADHGRVNPTVPHWGGPTGIRREAHRELMPIFSVGNSRLRQGIELLQPKSGFSLGSAFDGWTHAVYQLLPGIPGDSGGPTLDAKGRATGVLSALGITPLPASNFLTDMTLALRYARSHGLPDLLLALGTEPFNPGQLPLG
jgi:hypothetical protein